MRQTVSSGSVRAIYLDREKVIDRTKQAAADAFQAFPNIIEIRLVGSFAKGEETGLSDVDIFLLVESEEKNPIERIKPYFNFFADRMDIAVDVIAATKSEVINFDEMLKESIVLQRRGN